MNKLLSESHGVKQVIGPVDANTGANTGARVAIAGLDRVAFVASLGAGTSTSSHTFTLKQHDAASAGNSYDLSVANPYFHKVGAATVHTKVAPTVAAAAYDLHTLLSDSASIVVFEVLPEQLRSDCKWVSIDLTDAGGAQLCSVVAVAGAEMKPAYENAI